MSYKLDADDARCQVMQAQAVLSLWLNTMTNSDGNLPDMIGAVITLLEGVPEVMEALFLEHSDLQIAAMRGRKS
ncbi:hypothetical protein [Serratia sp. M24T3]|uniref:hypothetical protein n=1 Tax=Serratia sp. M24T3 TaxID=932213 RepID=UPI00025BAE88|nr:hypothetical protein [Serratia sp. M24T3]EIC82982.1 hypothetical protein SPM24T3_19403 [Serratia sp. M24T3]